jgi:EAL domain-containing protein (putative c-di-GMP-specific phosphodiesterase class I)
VIERFSLDGIHCHYQPVVDLERRTVVGYEALCRGAAGSQLEPPLELFAAARRAARLNETDWACRRASLRGARQAGLRAPLKLFINVEPSALGGESPERMAGLSEDALREVDLVVEFTERAITESPAELLRSINRVRQLGAAVAIDDVGPGGAPLAIVPLVRPDVVKLDLSIVHNPTDRDSARVGAAISAYSEAAGARVVAEGIEREEHIVSALALGATLGQGWLFGRPGPLPEPLPSAQVRLPIGGVPARTPASSPAALVGRSLPLRRGAEDLVRELAGQLLGQAGEMGEHAVVAASVAPRPGAPLLLERLAPLARDAALVALVGANVELAGAHIGRVEPGEPLAREWNLAVLGPYFAGALVARLVDGEPDGTCDFALTHDPEIVGDVAANLVARAVE